MLPVMARRAGAAQLPKEYRRILPTPFIKPGEPRPPFDPVCERTAIHEPKAGILELMVWLTRASSWMNCWSRSASSEGDSPAQHVFPVTPGFLVLGRPVMERADGSITC